MKEKDKINPSDPVAMEELMKRIAINNLPENKERILAERNTPHKVPDHLASLPLIPDECIKNLDQ